jgi:hypothetical protein
LSSGHHVSGMPQVVEVQFREADRCPGLMPELAEVRPAQPSAFRADEDEAPGSRIGEALQVDTQLRRDVLGNATIRIPARLRVVIDQPPLCRMAPPKGLRQRARRQPYRPGTLVHGGLFTVVAGRLWWQPAGGRGGQRAAPFRRARASVRRKTRSKEALPSLLKGNAWFAPVKSSYTAVSSDPLRTTSVTACSAGTSALSCSAYSRLSSA